MVFFGHLRVPARRCDLVVPADWGWGRSNENYLLLDNQSTVNQIANPSMLKNIR